MKVAFYYDLPPGGALIHTLSWLKELGAHHQVKVFSPVPPESASRLARDLQCFFWSRLTAQKIAKEMNANFDVAYVTHDRFMQAPWLLKYLTIPSLHYSHNPTRAFFEPELGINPSWPLPNRLYERGLRAVKKRAEIRCARSATNLATSSQYMVRYLRNAYHVHSVLAYPGVDPQIFRALKLQKKFQVVLVGNDESQKSLRLALSALSLLPPASRPALVIISPRDRVGEGIKKLARDLGLSIKIYSGLTPREMNKLYNSSVLTLSVALREPFGLSVVESLSAGTPVVAVKEGGFVETVRDGVDGVLVERSAEGVAKGISHALTHLHRYRPHSRFTLESSHQTLLKLLTQLPKYPR